MDIRKRHLTDVWLNGEPAVALGLTEGKDGNDPWELGHLLAQAWEEANQKARGELR
jgi:hypothetical protein